MKSLFFNKTLVSNPNSLPVVKLFCLGLLFTFAGSIWIGCSEEAPSTPDPPDPVKMSVTVWPQDGAANVDFNIKPTYTFSVELNDELPEISIVRKGDGATINHNLIKVSSTLYRIEFPLPLTEEETYERYLHNAIGKNGEVLTEPLPQITSFTTKDVVVIPPLVLSAVSPLSGEEISHETTTLMYSADYALDPATVGPAYTLTNTTSGMQVLASVNVSGKDVSVNVDGLLEHSSAYSAVFDPNVIRGMNGETPSTTYSFSFTTEVVLAPLVFTTPESYLQHTGIYKDGYSYVGGMGLDDEGFTACFDSEGDSVWFHPFKVNGHYTRIRGMAATQDGVYSLLEVKPNPDPFVKGEVWLYYQSNNGEYLNKWQRTTGSTSKSITSSETEVYIAYIKDNMGHVDRFSSSGFRSSILYDFTSDLHFYNGYLYIAGSLPSAGIFLSKWQADLSDSPWYKEVKHSGVNFNTSINLSEASGRLNIIGFEFNIGGTLILQQYNANGDLLADLSFPSYNGNFVDYCSDGTDTYFVGNRGLYRISIAGNLSQINPIIGFGVFGLTGPVGSGNKVAVTDNTNVLKLFE